MPASDDKPDHVEDQVVGKDRTHVVRVRAGPPHQSLDLENDALLDPALEIIRADLRRDDEVTHEHAVEFAFFVAPADDPASEQSPIDLLRSVDLQSFARDQIADESDGLRIDRASPIVGVTKRAS